MQAQAVSQQQAQQQQSQTQQQQFTQGVVLSTTPTTIPEVAEVQPAKQVQMNQVVTTPDQSQISQQQSQQQGIQAILQQLIGNNITSGQGEVHTVGCYLCSVLFYCTFSVCRLMQAPFFHLLLAEFRVISMSSSVASKCS